MTIAEAKALLVKTALGEVGYAEGANNYNKYASEWTSAGGWNAQNQPWCDIFADWCYIHSFGIQTAAILTYQPMGGFSALCSASANYYKNNGAWFSTPAVGDQAFFYIGGDINHTGVVVGVTGGMVSVVEGNSSDAVRKNTYKVGDGYIAGYGRPKWEVFEGEYTEVNYPSTNEPVEPQEPNTCEVTATLPVIKYGDVSMWVKLMQTALISRGFNCGWYGADGDYGMQTKIALYEFQKKYANECGLADGLPDCVCGKATWKRLLELT